VGGYTTYQTLLTGTVNPGNRPAVDPAHNITAALATHPDAVLINLPSNDANAGYSEAETETNLLITASACRAANVPVWISTTQPRNLGTSGQNVLIAEKNWTISTFTGYPASYMDFWTTVANVDGSINATYGFGDGVHLNNTGHQLLYTCVVEARVYELLIASRALTLEPATSTVNIGFDTFSNLNHVLLSSKDLINWQPLTNIAGNNTTVLLPVPKTNSMSFYRLRLEPAQ
jgi:hypothetical protein